MSIGDVVARLDAARKLIDSARGAVNAATEGVDASAAIMDDTLDGSSAVDVQELLERFAGARRDLQELQEKLNAADEATCALRARLVAEGAVPDSPDPSSAAAAGARENRPRSSTTLPTASAETPESVVTPAFIEQLREELPPPVERGRGQKTHGRWIDQNGQVHREASGNDQKSDEAKRFFREDLKLRGIPHITTDVETKLAAHTRRNGIRAATLVINNCPCPGRMGCNALLPVILPSGYTLTVHGPNGFRRQYKGGKEWAP